MTDLLVAQHGPQPFTWGEGDLQHESDTRNAYLAALRAANNTDYRPLRNRYGDEPLGAPFGKTAPTLFFCRSGRLHLLPYRGGLAHLSVHGRWRRLVDHRELASLDLDLPRRGPFRHLVVSEFEAIREFIALELIRSRVGVHR